MGVKVEISSLESETSKLFPFIVFVSILAG